jgi:phosphoglycerate kinase
MFQFDDIRRLGDLETESKRVFVRADLDCPITSGGEVIEFSKVRAAAPTLRWLLERGVPTVVGAHLGALTKSKRRPSLEACGAELAGLLNADVLLPDENEGPLARKLVADLKPGQLVLLENLARDPGEAETSLDAARRLSEGFDVYVGDALPGTLSSSSLSLVPKLCAERVMGLRVESELTALHATLHGAGRSTWCVGGRFAQRHEVLRRALPYAHCIIVGAELSRPMLAARGHDVALDATETELVPRARTWLEQARDLGVEVILPSDLVAGNRSTPLTRSATRVPAGEAVLDLGQASVTRASAVLQQSARVLFLDHLGNGVDTATMALIEAAAAAENQTLLVNDELLDPARLFKERVPQVRYVSSSKSGMLALLCGQRVPALDALRMA